MKQIALAILGIFLLGCSGTNKLTLRQEAVQTPATETDEIKLDPEDEIYFSSDYQLDVVLQLYQEALDSADAGSNLAAQNLFESAIINIADIEAESLGVHADDLEWLRWELVSDYAGFLSKMQELPAESSPSAVYICLSQFLGDSISSPEDLIGLLLPASEAPIEADTVAKQQLYPDVPLIVNRYVNNALEFYRTKGRKVFGKWLERANEAIPYYTALLKDEGMPEELVYLAMIESGFSTRAYSRSHASGPWQFISSTACIYGLKVDYWYDERRDPERSTRAACKYLKKLYDEFGDWYLAFAGYNCGERRIHRAMRKSGKRNYWELRQHLPRQTREYIPSYLAARIICQDPIRYGFKPLDFKVPIESKTVFVDGCVSLKEIARCADTNHDLIKKLNPALKRDCTPPDAKNFAVNIPKGTGENFSERISKAPRLEKTEWIRHRVRTGETLSTIAAKYGVSMRAIMEIPANKIRNPHKIRAGRHLLVPVWTGRSSSSTRSLVGQPQPPQLTTSNGKARTIYRVRKGDSLSEIADKFSVRVADIKAWNHLWEQRFIYPGQKLIIWTKSAKSSHREADTAMIGPILTDSSDSKPRVHLVQPGDTLWDIAQLYGVSVQNLKNWNGIRSARRLMPGIELKLEP